MENRIRDTPGSQDGALHEDDRRDTGAGTGYGRRIRNGYQAAMTGRRAHVDTGIHHHRATRLARGHFRIPVAAESGQFCDHIGRAILRHGLLHPRVRLGLHRQGLHGERTACRAADNASDDEQKQARRAQTLSHAIKDHVDANVLPLPESLAQEIIGFNILALGNYLAV